MEKKQNILFIIVFLLIISAIGLYNYYADPYDIIHNSKQSIYISDYPRNMYSTVIKLSKNRSFEYVALGSSTMQSFLSNYLFKDKKTIYMMTERFDLNQQIKFLELILSIHPEIKTIIFPIEYPFYYYERDLGQLDVPEEDEKNLTIKEFFNLFLSLRTTLVKITNNNEKKTSEIVPFKWHKKKYKVYYKRNCQNEYMRDFEEPNYFYFNKLKEILNNKQQKIIFIIPPYHGTVQGTIYKKNLHKEVEDIKRYLVNNFKDAEIYDYAFINKFTAESLETTTNYTDAVHPLGHPGHLFFCVLKNPKKFENKKIFIKLSKTNIEKVLSWQKERLKKYIQINQQYINKYMKYTPFEEQNDYIQKEFSPPSNCDYYIYNL